MTPKIKAKLDIIAQAALSRLPTLYFSFERADSHIQAGTPGDFVECGVYAGAQCAAFALACQLHSDDRKIHLFDSFEGIPEAGPKDDARLSGQSVSSIENTKGFMNKWGVDPSRLVYHPGWFTYTLEIAHIPEIAILRLDADLYDSTRICLEKLYQYVVPSGTVIIDDYHLGGCKQAVHDFEREHDFEFTLNEIKGGHGPVWLTKSA